MYVDKLPHFILYHMQLKKMKYESWAMGQWSCSPYTKTASVQATPNSIRANALVFHLLSGGVSQCGVKSPSPPEIRAGRVEGTGSVGLSGV